MDTELLKTFLEVQKTGHFGKAAEHLYLTQSAVSFRIRQLEQNLGTSLFHRSRNNIQLTQAGETLLPYALSVVQALSTARNHIQQQLNQQLPLQLRVHPNQHYIKRLPVGVMLLNQLRQFGGDFSLLAEPSADTDLFITASAEPTTGYSVKALQPIAWFAVEFPGSEPVEYRIRDKAFPALSTLNWVTTEDPLWVLEQLQQFGGVAWLPAPLAPSEQRLPSAAISERLWCWYRSNDSRLQSILTMLT